MQGALSDISAITGSQLVNFPLLDLIHLGRSRVGCGQKGKVKLHAAQSTVKSAAWHIVDVEYECFSCLLFL